MAVDASNGDHSQRRNTVSEQESRSLALVFSTSEIGWRNRRIIGTRIRAPGNFRLFYFSVDNTRCCCCCCRCRRDSRTSDTGDSGVMPRFGVSCVLSSWNVLCKCVCVCASVPAINIRHRLSWDGAAKKARAFECGEDSEHGCCKSTGVDGRCVPDGPADQRGTAQ